MRGMKRPYLTWGLVLTVAGFLLFRFGITTFYPEAISIGQTAGLRQFWDGLTVMQKVAIAGMEVPFFSGIVLLILALLQLLSGKDSPR
jgi:hypothetical protein